MVQGEKIIIRDETKEVKDEGAGVPAEVRAWSESIATGNIDARQIPEEALADLEIIEACLRSGEQGGKPMKLEYQEWR